MQLRRRIDQKREGEVAATLSMKLVSFTNQTTTTTKTTGTIRSRLKSSHEGAAKQYNFIASITLSHRIKQHIRKKKEEEVRNAAMTK